MESIVEVRALCFLMMGRWCIGSMCEGRTDIGCYVRSFIWNKVKYAILEKGSYIEKWSDSNEQNRGMQRWILRRLLALILLDTIERQE